MDTRSASPKLYRDFPHHLVLQATAIVTDRLNASKPPPTTASGKSAPSQINVRDLDVDLKREDSGFFGSFFSPKGPQAKKKGGGGGGGGPTVMESVCGIRFYDYKSCSDVRVNSRPL